MQFINNYLYLIACITIKLCKTNIGVLMKNKLLITSALATSLFAGSALAQTTVTGSLDLTYNALSKDLAGGLASNRGIGRETQLNVQNKGKTNIAGLDYAAGFSLEFDGTTTGSATVSTAPDNSMTNENVFIDLIIGNTTLTMGVDHIQRGYAGAAPQIVNITDQMAGAGSQVTFVIGAKTSEMAGVGIMQKIPGAGITASYYYAPKGQDVGIADMGAQSTTLGTNSSYEYGINGVDTFGVKGLTVVAFKNAQDKSTSALFGDIEGKQYGIGYNFGQFAVGIDKLVEKNMNLAAGAALNPNGESATRGIERDTQRIGVTYSVNKDLTVGLVQTKTDHTGSATATENGTEKVQAIQVGYSLGPVALALTHAKFDDLAGRDGTAAGDNGTLSIARLSTRF